MYKPHRASPVYRHFLFVLDYCITIIQDYYITAWEMHCNNLRLVLGLGLVRVSNRVRVRVRIRVKVRVSVLVRVSIRTS